MTASGDRDQLLHESERTRVVRVHLPDGRRVVVKQPLGTRALERRDHERAILGRLAGVAGVAQLADVASTVGPAAIVLEDGGAEPLTGQRMVGDELLELARALATTIGHLHQRGVVHKDINPANVLAGPLLIDFGLATTNALERPGFTHHSEIAGTMPYLAPEQTGRTGRPVDHRADLYALGATLYELATGRPPFGDGDGGADPLQLIHDHLARVPTPPVELDDRIPQGFSDVILRLLEKEPDRRYQSGEGLASDLRRLQADPGATFPLGERDYPVKLSPPSRLIGRDEEIAALGRALGDAVAGRARGVLVAGAPGVGKTSLVDELRPMVTAAGGWFVTGKFDQHRRDIDADGLRQALRALGRLLLAEPEADLAELRARILERLGPNAGGVAALLPELAVLLGTAPDEGSHTSLDGSRRMIQAGLDLLRGVVSPARPLVLVVDDLQWASPNAIALLDALLTDDSLCGLLVVGAYRDTEVDAAHPLSGMLARWERLGAAPVPLPLENLATADVGSLLQELLRLPADEASRLADVLAARTAGNPYDTLELVNALRRDGALAASEDGWSWDEATIRRFVGEGDVVDLLSARIATMPVATRSLLEVLACLGGEVHHAVLEVATGRSRTDLVAELSPALEDGLLVLERGGDEAVRFRHDRVQQAVHTGLGADDRDALHLRLARRLGATGDLGTMAAEQYLQAAGSVADPDERRHAAELLRTAAAGARLTNSALAERLLTTALALLGTDGGRDLVVALEVELHAALYGLGRLDDADRVYASVARRGTDPLAANPAACVQICSLANRGRPADAVALGIAQLAKLGRPLPDDVMTAVFGGVDTLAAWVAAADLATDLARPELADEQVLAVAELINKLLPPALFTDRLTYAWLVLEGHRLWVEEGPCAPLVACLGAAPVLLVVLKDDFTAAYSAARHAIALATARGYEPAASAIRFLFAMSAAHWFEPLEDSVGYAHMALEGLLQGGDLQYACFTYSTSIPALLDTAPSLESTAAEIDAGLGLAARTGNDHATGGFLPYRQLIRALRGETASPGSFTDASLDEDRFVAGLADNAGAACVFHVQRALSALVFGDGAALAAHTGAAMLLIGGISGRYPVAIAHVLRAVALADAARASEGDERDTALGELDTCRGFLAARAADAPANFGHLLALVDAERAWAAGDRWAAASAFDASLAEVGGRSRPWHRAVTTERAAVFHLQAGLEHTGSALLGEARDLYRAWGATGKVERLEADHTLLRAPRRRGYETGASGSINVSADAIDLLAVLEASRALSSETDLDRLRDRVVEVLSAMTGATSVRLVLSDHARGWVVPGEAAGLTVEEAGEAGLLAVSAFRYAERTGEPLMVADACHDDRFSRDPHLAGAERCSLLVVPILVRGEPQAMLVLENRLSRGVFTDERLDAVMLVAGQLAVSLDNALVYASLEQKVAERTEALQAANERLEALSTTDPLTGLANRRRLADVLDAEWRRAMRPGVPLAVAMIDIDHFKRYNDRYGHLAGDACLRRVAAALHESVRFDCDLVARYGGEEFAVVLPGADLEEAAVVAERMRAAVAGLREPHAGVAHEVVTVSIGVAAVVAAPDADPGRLLEAADARLYDAKRAGRNQVALAATQPIGTGSD